MSKYMWVRPARPSEAQQVLDWSLANSENGFDPDTIRYPSTLTFCAFDQTGPVAFLPVQSPLVMDSLATRPGARPEQVAMALKELTQHCVSLAYPKGAGEILFLASEDTIKTFVDKQQVFEKLPWTVYRLKISDLEKPRN